MGTGNRLHTHRPEEGGTLMHITTLGIELAKTVFQLHGFDARGQVVLSWVEPKGKKIKPVSRQ